MTLRSKIWTTVIDGVEYQYYKFDSNWCVKQRLHRPDRHPLDASDWELISDNLVTRAAAEDRIRRYAKWLTAVRAR